MVCIHCGGATQVFNSRPQKRSNQVWRRRKCTSCGSIFSTDEIIDFATALRVRDATNHLNPLQRDKLFLSLHKSLSHRPTAIADANGLTATILAKVTPLASNGAITSHHIVRIASVALSRFDTAAAIHYQAFHKKV